MRPVTGGIATAVVVAAALALAGGDARAATVTLAADECIPRAGCPPDRLEVHDTAGEPNDLAIARDGDSFVVTDTRTPPTAGAGCASEAPERVRCRGTTSSVTVTVRAGAGDDAVDAGGLDQPGRFGSTTLDGGPGDDVLRGFSSTDSLRGGGGIDRLEGRAGDDFLHDGDRSGADAGADALGGGPGVDTVDYEGRTAGVTVDLVAGGPAGEPGEGDVLTAVESVYGGDGDDVLRAPPGSASPGGTTVAGRGGGDRIAAGGQLLGGPGDDVVEGGPAADRIEGGGGRDRLLGAGGDDLVTDSDTIRAFPAPPPPADGDVLDGGDGRDTLSYGGRTIAVTVDLAAGIGGATGEADALSGFEDVLGGESGDVLRGDAGANRLVADGQLGLVAGADLRALDRLAGGGGDDLLEGGQGPDAYDGGDGADTIVPGNAGDRDERVACGPGSDLVQLPDPRDVPAGCERLQLDQLPAGTFVRLSRRALRRGRLWFGVECPCREALEARFTTLAGRTLARRVLRPRADATYALRVPPRARRFRVRYVSARVGIDTGFTLRLPSRPRRG